MHNAFLVLIVSLLEIQKCHGHDLGFSASLTVSLECHGENMVAKLKSHSPFYGKMFAMPTPTPDCEVFGRGEILTTISYPLNSCGVHK